MPSAAAPTLGVTTRSLLMEDRVQLCAGSGGLLSPWTALHVARHGYERRSAQRVDAALCERRGWRLRAAVPVDGTSAVPVLLASRDAPVGSRRLLPRNVTPDPSRARDVPGRCQSVALGIRDFTIGLSRSTAVSATPSRGSGFGERRVRPRAAACRRPLLSGGSGSSARSAGGPDARTQPDVGE